MSENINLNPTEPEKKEGAEPSPVSPPSPQPEPKPSAPFSVPPSSPPQSSPDSNIPFEEKPFSAVPPPPPEPTVQPQPPTDFSKKPSLPPDFSKKPFQPFREDEKLEFLKRAEIKTMAKDVSQLREMEAQGERERISVLKEGKLEVKREEFVVSPPSTAPTPTAPPSVTPIPRAYMPQTEVFPQPEKEIPKPPPPVSKPPLEIPTIISEESATLIPKPPKKPPLVAKVMARIFAVAIFLAAVGFIVWNFLINKPEIPSPPPPPPPIQPITPTSTLPVIIPEIYIPLSLISVAATKTSEISQNADIPMILEQLMQENIPLNAFERIIIKNTAENRLATLEEIVSAHQITATPQFYQDLESDFTFAIFNQAQGKRIAVVARIKDKNDFNNQLKSWEDKIKKEGLLFEGKKIPTYTSYFRMAYYKGNSFKYMTISRKDYGVCYGVINDYFIFTTSFESMKGIIVDLLTPKPESKIGQLFFVGFDGTKVTPQLEAFLKKYQPGGVALLAKNIENATQLKTLISDLQEISLRESGLPLLVAVDQEGGLISRIGFLQEKTAQSAIQTKESAYQIGYERGIELKNLGVNVNFAPVLDVADPGDFIFERTFQKTPLETGELGKYIVLGQKDSGILTTIKHFPGYGKISFHPEEQLATVDKIPEISQFKKAVEMSPEFVMTSNVIYSELDPSQPFIFSPSGINFLKSNLGSNILIISDDLDQNSLLNRFSLKEIVLKPLQAGVDMLIVSGWRGNITNALDTFITAYNNNEISKSEIGQKVLKIINFKEQYIK